MWHMGKGGTLARYAPRGQGFGAKPSNCRGQAEHQEDRPMLRNPVFKSSLGCLVKPLSLPSSYKNERKGKEIIWYTQIDRRSVKSQVSSPQNH